MRSDEEIGGGSTWTIGVAHRDSLFSANGKHSHARDEPAKQANAKFEGYMVNEGDGRALHVRAQTNHIPTAGLHLFTPSSQDWLPWPTF